MIFQKRTIDSDSFFVKTKISKENDARLNPKILNHQDRIKYQTYKSNRRKREFLAARHIVKDFFSGSDISYLENGAPYLTNTNTQLSISHSNDFITVLFSKYNCGCDIEVIGDKARKVSHKFSSSLETAIEAPINNNIKYTLYWSVKECLYKLHKEGGLDFIENIHILALDFENKTIKTEIEKAGIKTEKTVYFEITEQYVLTWVIG